MSRDIRDLTLRHHGPEDSLALRDALVPIYATTHSHLLDQPWYSPDDWWARLTDIYSRTRDFDLVTGWLGETVVGYAFGSPRDDGVLWPAIQAVLPQVTPGGPVYIFREFAVAPPVQRCGFGRLIHDELLRARGESAAHLLVRPDNIPALAAYRSWGWVRIGEAKPFEDSPIFDAMTLDLGGRSGRG